MHVGLDNDVDAADAVQLNLLVLVVPPVAHPGHVGPPGVELLVACVEVSLASRGDSRCGERTLDENNILVETRGELAGLVGLDPRVVVDCCVG